MGRFNHRKSKVPLLLAAAVIVGGSALGINRVLRSHVPQSAEIFLVDSAVSYGDTSLDGILQTGTVEGGETQLILVTAGGTVIELDVTGLEDLVGKEVTVQGFLNLPASEGLAPVMNVASIESK